MNKNGSFMLNQYKDYALATEQEFLDGLQCQDLQEEYSSSGVPLRHKDGKVYVDISDSHTLIFGSTGTKKTRNFFFRKVWRREPGRHFRQSA